MENICGAIANNRGYNYFPVVWRRVWKRSVTLKTPPVTKAS